MSLLQVAEGPTSFKEIRRSGAASRIEVGGQHCGMGPGHCAREMAKQCPWTTNRQDY